MEPKEKKILIYSGIGIALIGSYLFLTKNDNSGGSEDPTGNAQIGVGNVESSFNAKKTANELYEVMSFTVPNKTGIFNILRNVNQNQFGEVIKAFGKPKYNELYGNTMEWLWDTLPTKDLVFWLKQELGTEVQTLRLKYPKYL